MVNVFLFSKYYNQTKQETIIEENRKLEELNEAKILESNKKFNEELSKKHNAVLFDTLNGYTFKIINELIDNKKKLYVNGYIDDLTKVDTTYYLKINSDKKGIAIDGLDRKEYNNFSICISKQFLHELETKLNSSDKTNKGGFIITVDSIKTEIHNSILDIPNRIYIQGKLEDYYLNK